MTPNLTRRDFVKTSAAASLGLWAAGCATTPSPSGAGPGQTAFKTKLHKAMIRKPVEADLKALKEAGFDGFETNHICPPEEAAQGRALAEKFGLRIHSVLRGWADFNSDDPAKVESSLEVTRNALRAAHAYGADAILLVPCRIDSKKIPTPEPWEFDIRGNPSTGEVTQVVAGDNSKFQDYIKAQNHATETSRAAVKKLIPLAEELKVVIALENVWNNLWVRPGLFRAFVASFNSRWVKAYYDVGNHMKYIVPPEDWIRTLGSLIVKIHIKDYALAPDKRSGKFVHPRDGSVDWPAVRQAIEDVRYNGWLTIEDGGLPLEEFSKRLDLIIAGK